MKRINVDGRPAFILRALSDINIGEELRYNYDHNDDGSLWWRYKQVSEDKHHTNVYVEILLKILISISYPNFILLRNNNMILHLKQDMIRYLAGQ
jgi:hypothetical protein